MSRTSFFSHPRRSAIGKKNRSDIKKSDDKLIGSVFFPVVRRAVVVYVVSFSHSAYMIFFYIGGKFA